MAQVWRKIQDGTEDHYQLVNQVWVNLRQDRVNVHILRPFESFTVQPGDVIGWATPVGEPGLQYSPCSTNRKVHQVDIVDMHDLVDGMGLVVPVKDACRTYSIALVVGKGKFTSYE